MTAARKLQRFEMLAEAERLLALPPKHPWIDRPAPRGDLVARFVLPLELCQPQNRTRHGKPWALGKLKQDVYLCLLTQRGPRESALDGRPQLRCCRFSSSQCDACSDWAKHAIDALCRPRGRRRHGLGFLRDDRPKDVDVRQWWEPAPAGKGFCLLEVWTG